jgi:hypothetical protein
MTSSALVNFVPCLISWFGAKLTSSISCRVRRRLRLQIPAVISEPLYCLPSTMTTPNGMPPIMQFLTGKFSGAGCAPMGNSLMMGLPARAPSRTASCSLSGRLCRSQFPARRPRALQRKWLPHARLRPRPARARPMIRGRVAFRGGPRHRQCESPAFWGIAPFLPRTTETDRRRRRPLQGMLRRRVVRP